MRLLLLITALLILGCSPYFAAYVERPWLRARPHELELTENIVPRNCWKAKHKEKRYHSMTNRNYDHRRQTSIREIDVCDRIWVRNGLRGHKAPFTGPCVVVRTAKEESFPESLCYLESRLITKLLACGVFLKIGKEDANTEHYDEKQEQASFQNGRNRSIEENKLRNFI